NSSRRISPGCTTGPKLAASRGMLSVVVLATDVVRIVPLPPECDPVSLVHANAVLSLPVPSQRLQAIAGTSRQIIQSLRAVRHRQLPMHNRPDVAGHTPRG